MILSQEQWMELRAFKALADAGATWAEIARETGYDWRTVKRYLSYDASAAPPAPAKRGPGRRKTDPYAHLIDAWLRRQPKLKASVIWERLVAEHGFQGHYQRVKVYVRENRARLTEAEPEPAGFHRRFEVLAGAQAQVARRSRRQPVSRPSPGALVGAAGSRWRLGSARPRRSPAPRWWPPGRCSPAPGRDGCAAGGCRGR
jgi:transposase